MWTSPSPLNKCSSHYKLIAQNLHLTATIGLSAVRKQAKKFDMLLTTIRRPRSLMVRQFFLWTSGLRLTVSGASRTVLQWQLKMCGPLSVKIRIPPLDHVLSDMVHFSRVHLLRGLDVIFYYLYSRLIITPLCCPLHLPQVYRIKGIQNESSHTHHMCPYRLVRRCTRFVYKSDYGLER